MSSTEVVEGILKLFRHLQSRDVAIDIDLAFPAEKLTQKDIKDM